MGERIGLIKAAMDLHQKALESHLVVMHELLRMVEQQPRDPPAPAPPPAPQHIILTGPTSASALAPLPGTELTIFRMIPSHRRLWDHCLGTNYRFEPTSFVRMFPGCGHYFWYRHAFEMENGVAVCSQCSAEEHIVTSETAMVTSATVYGPPSEPPPSPPPPTSPPSGLRRRARLLPDIRGGNSV